jgi:two-component system LytT family response regulator
MKVRCVVIDDEVHAMEGIKSYIKALPNLELVASYMDSLQAMNEIAAGSNVDIIFMDVDMPKISGVELAKAIRHKTDKLIFTTAHTKYAFEAFEINANAYLLKPYTIAQFAATIARFYPATEVIAPVSIKQEDDYFFVRNKNEGNNLVKIRYADLVAVESLQNYIRIYTLTESIVTYISISEIKVILEGYSNFMQVHRSFIISRDHIERIDGNTLKMSNGLTINVGNSFKDGVNTFIAEKTIKTSRS